MNIFRILFLVLMATIGRAATLQTINIGAAPNDGTGDPLRTALIKTSTNFVLLNLYKLESTNGAGLAGYTLISDGSRWYAAPATGLTNTFIWPDLVNGGSSQFLLRYKTNGIVFEYVDTFGITTTNLFFTTNGIIQFPNGLYVGAPMTVNTQIVQSLFLPLSGSNTVLQLDGFGQVTNTPSGVIGQVLAYTTIGGRYTNAISLTTLTVNGGGSNIVFDSELTINSNAWFRQSLAISNQVILKTREHFVATNSTVNSNLTINFDVAVTEIYATNNVSVTNFSGMTAGELKHTRLIIRPQLINRTIVYPTPGAAGYGTRWWTNLANPLLATLNAGSLYELDLRSRGTNVDAELKEFK